MEAFTDSYTLRGDWWYFGAYLLTRRSGSGIEPTTAPGVITLKYTDPDVDITIVITGAQGRTYINVTASSYLRNECERIKADLMNFARVASSIQRADSGVQFRTILDHYYKQRQQGKNPNLRILAEQYKVKYSSLRQYKIRYDAERRADVSE